MHPAPRGGAWGWLQSTLSRFISAVATAPGGLLVRRPFPISATTNSTASKLSMTHHRISAGAAFPDRASVGVWHCCCPRMGRGGECLAAGFRCEPQRPFRPGTGQRQGSASGADRCGRSRISRPTADLSPTDPATSRRHALNSSNRHRTRARAYGAGSTSCSTCGGSC